jgi:hypothetical protein
VMRLSGCTTSGPSPGDFRAFSLAFALRLRNTSARMRRTMRSRSKPAPSVVLRMSMMPHDQAFSSEEKASGPDLVPPKDLHEARQIRNPWNDPCLRALGDPWIRKPSEKSGSSRSARPSSRRPSSQSP